MGKTNLAFGVLLFCIMMNIVEPAFIFAAIPLGLIALWMLYSEYKKEKNKE